MTVAAPQVGVILSAKNERPQSKHMSDYNTLLADLLRLIMSPEGREIWPCQSIFCKDNEDDQYYVVIQNACCPAVQCCCEVRYLLPVASLGQACDVLANNMEQSENWRITTLNCDMCINNTLLQDRTNMWWIACSCLEFQQYPLANGEYVCCEATMDARSIGCLLCADSCIGLQNPMVCYGDVCRDKVNFATKCMIAYMFLTAVTERDICWQIGMLLAKMCRLKCAKAYFFCDVTQCKKGDFGLLLAFCMVLFVIIAAH